MVGNFLKVLRLHTVYEHRNNINMGSCTQEQHSQRLWRNTADMQLIFVLINTFPICYLFCVTAAVHTIVMHTVALDRPSYYPSSFTAALQHSLLPFNIHYYLSTFTTALHHSLLTFIIHCHPSSFNTTLH